MSQAMNQKTSISRRKFLKAAGIVLGSAVVIGTGMTVLGDPQQGSTISMPDSTFGGENMSKRILVTYASQAGATAGVAEAIAKSLAQTGATVDLRPVKEVTDLSTYKAVVIGSAVHSGKWLPEATAFVRRNQSRLCQMPTAIFQVCMMLACSNQQYRSMVPTWLDPLREELNPVSTGSFSGAVLLDHYPKLTDKLGMKIFLASVKIKEGDYRDWAAIQSWSEYLRPLLLN